MRDRVLKEKFGKPLLPNIQYLVERDGKYPYKPQGKCNLVRADKCWIRGLPDGDKVVEKYVDDNSHRFNMSLRIVVDEILEVAGIRCKVRDSVRDKFLKKE